MIIKLSDYIENKSNEEEVKTFLDFASTLVDLGPREIVVLAVDLGVPVSRFGAMPGAELLKAILDTFNAKPEDQKEMILYKLKRGERIATKNIEECPNGK